MKFLVESEETYYRFEIESGWGNRGGLFTNIWDLVYSEDISYSEQEKAYLSEIEDLIDDLMEAHQSPDLWLDEDVKFAFTQSFYTKYKSKFEKLATLMAEFDYKLIKTELKRPE